MEQPPTTELTKRTPKEIAADTSHALIRCLQEATLAPTPPEAWGIHGTTYRLKIWAGMNSSELTWYGKLPTEWADLEPVVSILQMFADENAVEA